jgi:hypothetical protein
MFYALMGRLHPLVLRRVRGIQRLAAGEKGQGLVRRPDPAGLAADGRDGRGDERVQQRAVWGRNREENHSSCRRQGLLFTEKLQATRS